MGIGSDMYEQHCLREFLSSDEWITTRRSAIEAAKLAMEANCDVDFPTMGLVNMVRSNRRRGMWLLIFCYGTCFLPWFLVRRFAPCL
jgi:hypothetical protein